MTSVAEITNALAQLRESALDATQFDSRPVIVLDAEWTAEMDKGNRTHGKVGIIQLSTVSVPFIVDVASGQTITPTRWLVAC